VVVLVARPIRAELNQAAVYLNRLGAGSRRTMRQALDAIAELVGGSELDADRFPWEQLRYQHTQAIRAHLMTDSPSRRPTST
jgi:hypothetical protein